VADCSEGTWNISPPNPDLSFYFVAVQGEVSQRSVTGLFDGLIGNLREHQVVRVKSVGCTAGQVEVADGLGGYTCETLSCPPGMTPQEYVKLHTGSHPQNAPATHLTIQAVRRGAFITSTCIDPNDALVVTPCGSYIANGIDIGPGGCGGGP
jgi:hypothetical protein